MNPWLKKYGLEILMAGVIIALLIFSFRGCGGARDNTEGRRQMDSLTRVADQARRELAEYRAAKDREVDSIRTIQFKTQLQANTARSEIRRLIAKGSGIIATAPAERGQDPLFDSLAIAFNDLAETAATYVDLIDTIQVQYQAQLAAKDSVIARQGELLFKLQHASVEMNDKYTALERDYLKSEKKRKRNGNINRILAGALVVATGIAIAK